VYTKPGIYREGCQFVDSWKAYKCVGGKHRHLLIEVMDWNHMTRRWAPVSVEVNDDYKPQGGYMNILTGPAMYWTTPGFRLQTFHALGHAGLRHNIYFSADPPQHLRLHYQYADPTDGIIACVYYGIPNNLVAYVGGQRKEAPLEMTPTWDNLVFNRLTPDMDHGTFYYDRIGVETGRPGYLYTVLRGSQHVDFKVSHKVVLTSKIKVDTDWGGWTNQSGNNFYKKGIDGLVRNIALLIGCPPSRIKILGNGTATKGTFWNEKTTSTEFAEWIWKQNQSMDRMDMKKWLQAPGAELAEDSVNSSLLQHDVRKLSFLSKFASHRHDLLAAALETRGSAGERWHHHLVFLTKEEQAAVLQQRALTMLEQSGNNDLAALNDLQQATQDRQPGGPVDAFNAELAREGAMLADVEVDEEDHAPSSGSCAPDRTADCETLDEHAYNTGELVMETDTMKAANLCAKDDTGGCTLPNQAPQGNSQTDLLKVVVDHVPTKTNPLGWLCSNNTYRDGICDCECGIWDPDCEPGSVTVGALNNGSAALSLLDQQQKFAVLNFLDTDSNGNGIIDGMEVQKIKTLGISALYGVAMRILSAQENGESGTRAYHKGDWAHLQAEPSSSCNYLLSNPPFPKGAAKYTPVCIKDEVWETRLGQPTGRCGLLPEMAIGSQCEVPGRGTAPALVSINGSSPKPKSVCGSMMQIFPSGGMGGIFSAGVGVTDADYYNKGGTFMPGVEETDVLMQKLDFSAAPMNLNTKFDNGMSFYARVKYDTFTDNSRIFSFGDGLARREKYRIEGACDGRNDGETSQLSFYVMNYHNRRRHDKRYKHMKVESGCRVGKEDEFLFIYSTCSSLHCRNINKDQGDDVSGTVTVWRNGVELKTEATKVSLTLGYEFQRLVVGHTPYNHGHIKGVDGDIKDIRIWSSAVTWPKAVSGTAPGESPSDANQDEEGEIETKCMHSKKNSWDFVCGDEMPAELADRFGYTSMGDTTAQNDFKKKELQGDVSRCGAKISAKAVMYQGKFGDGLTGEYYKIRTDCNRPPFLFGMMPKMVSVDSDIKYTGTEFISPYNELVIRWTGKLLIDATGSYDFKISADDMAWLAIDGLTLVTNNDHGSGTPCRKNPIKEATKSLEKGAHDISILYMNKGPAGAGTPGKFEMWYKGPDTQGSMQHIPTSKLGSAPLRLAKLAKELGKSENSTKVAEVMPGAFIYDEDHHVGIMPKGSCDLKCQRGLRKTAGAYFKFFCPTSVKGHVVARVNANAKHALMWLDGKEGRLWSLGSSLVQETNTASSLSLSEEKLSFDEILASSLGLGSFKLNDDPGAMASSLPSPEVSVDAGEHTLIVQGIPQLEEIFAMGQLSLSGGLEACSFFLEGRDKSTQDC